MTQADNFCCDWCFYGLIFCAAATQKLCAALKKNSKVRAAALQSTKLGEAARHFKNKNVMTGPDQSV